MKRCLVVGRTSDDVAECKRYGLSTHGPAPSTVYWNNFEMFDGDVITTHTIKYGAVWACTVETSDRVADCAAMWPKKVVVGLSALHTLEKAAPHLAPNAVILRHGPGLRYPDRDSGEFALWWAYRQGYKEIYTVGLDFIGDREKQARVAGMVRMFDGVNVYKTNELSRLPVPVKVPPVVGES